jgi:hypothetical protein
LRSWFDGLVVPNGLPSQQIVVRAQQDGCFSVDDCSGQILPDLTLGDLPSFLTNAVVRALVTKQSDAVALHAGAVARNGKAVLVVLQNGFDYLTDEIVLLQQSQPAVVGLPRSLVLKPGSAQHILEMPAFREATTVPAGTHLVISAPAGPQAQEPLPVSLIVFPDFVKGNDLEVEGLSPAGCGMKLVECNVNARNLPDRGFAAIARLSRRTPAMRLRYGDYDQLPARLDILARLSMDDNLEPANMRRLLAAFAQRRSGARESKASAPASQIPKPTPLRERKRALSIGMATYDDYDGVYFTLQALRMYHADASMTWSSWWSTTIHQGPVQRSSKNLRMQNHASDIFPRRKILGRWSGSVSSTRPWASLFW